MSAPTDSLHRYGSWRPELATRRPPMSRERSFHTNLSVEHVRSCASCQWVLSYLHDEAVAEDRERTVLLRDLDRA